ncbi:MAG: FeoC-like transcriptional regulator [Candidatus Eremiobacterota bacterium]
MIQPLLERLDRPRTAQDLAGLLSTTREAVEGMLNLLASRGYVGMAYDRSPTCGTACQGCSFKRLCPAQGEQAPFLQVWRLTAKGADALQRLHQSSDALRT